MIMNKIKTDQRYEAVLELALHRVRSRLSTSYRRPFKALHGPPLLDDLYDVRRTSSFSYVVMVWGERGREMERDHQPGNKTKEAILDRALAVGCIGGPQQSA
jgi:hypothetical protein